MFSMRARVFLFVITTLCATSFGIYPFPKEICAYPGFHTCGNLTIPYPFSTIKDCAYPGFYISCNKTEKQPRAFLGNGHIQVIKIFLETGEMKVYKHVDWRCYNSTYNVSDERHGGAHLPNRYLFSFTKNKFTAIGCDNMAYIWGGNGSLSYASGCVSYCGQMGTAKDGFCEGAGCCQGPVPQGLQQYEFNWGRNINNFYKENPCIYAIIVEQEWYNFRTNDLRGKNFLNKTDHRVPVVLDWAIRDGKCMPTPAKLPDACVSNHSYCYNATNGAGYLCNCSKGYEGNPYLEKGCQDINECNATNKGKYCNATCINTLGGFECKCKFGKYGNARLDECTDIFPTAARVVVGISGALVIIAVIIVTHLQTKKLELERKENFWKNGGEELEKLLKARVERIKVFTEEQLIKMTNNFDEKQIIGSGGQGNVYKGTLEDGSEVAVKRSKKFDNVQKEEFANEIATLSQINHRHVVRLKGCCLEVQIPMLVYEYIPNGTLFHFLHGRNRRSIPLGTRLRIAKESAEALSNLHSSMNCRILHGDVKSLNILLDNELGAKVSDFGASSLVPLEGDQLVDFVQGTSGYLDPQCFITETLTEKSDVHSFGVVILELITRKKAIYTNENGDAKSLAKAFIATMEENSLESILDKDVVNGSMKNVLREVAELALKCLSFMREDRPTMKEVADSLQALINSNRDLLSTKIILPLQIKIIH